MTITPCCKTGNMGSDPNFSCSSGSQQSAPFWAKSDHFGEHLELGTAGGGGGGVIRKNISNPGSSKSLHTVIRLKTSYNNISKSKGALIHNAA